MQSSHVLIDCAIATTVGAAFGAYVALQSPAPPWFISHLLAICAASFIALVLFGRDHLRLARWLLRVVCASALCIGAHQSLSPEQLPQIDDALLEGSYEVHAEVVRGCRPVAPPCGFEADIRVLQDEHTADRDAAPIRARIYLQDGRWSPLPGDVFRTRGRFKRPMRGLHTFAFNPEAWSQRQGIAASFQLEELPTILAVHPSIPRRIDAWRAHLENAMMRPHRPEAAGILVAMSTGTKSGISEEVRARFAAAGTAHVLAVSGLHLGLLAGILWWTLLRIFRCFPSILRRWNADALSAMITLPVLGIYILFTGMPTSAMRAGWMAAALLIPRIFNRRGSNLHGVCIAVTILLAHNPRLIVDLGFQLSVSATLSLVLLARSIGRQRTRKKEEEEARKAQEALEAHDDEQDHTFLFGMLGQDTVDTEQNSNVPSIKTPADTALQTSLRTEGWRFNLARLRYRFSRTFRAGEPAFFWTLSAFEVSVVSTLATAPFLVWNFGGVPVFSPLPNLLIVPPLSIVALPMGVAGAVLYQVWPWAGTALIDASLWVIDACLWLARTGAWIFEQELLLGRPELLGVIGWALVAAASPFLFRKTRRRWMFAALLGVFCIGGDKMLRAPSKNSIEIHAIPVGQGDATWLRFPDGRSMLIDGGGVGFGTSATGTNYVLPYLRGHGVGQVDILVATHGHADHVNGITELVPLLSPEQIWVGDDDLERPVDRALYDAAQEHGVPYHRPHQRWREVHIGEVRIEILPMPPAESINDGSLVLRICYEDFCAMMTGDAEAPREKYLVEHVQDLRAHYLKVGHHGSQTSTTEAFLSHINPDAAVIELGVDNRFGFPHEEVLDRLRAHKVPTWRTDRGQAVVHSSDGQKMWRITRHRWPDLWKPFRPQTRRAEAKLLP